MQEVCKGFVQSTRQSIDHAAHRNRSGQMQGTCQQVCGVASAVTRWTQSNVNSLRAVSMGNLAGLYRQIMVHHVDCIMFMIFFELLRSSQKLVVHIGFLKDTQCAMCQ